ncbi:MAG: DUF1542 domain-containing protein [Coriobacteriia bacterium]|nr:DUF1542 domain-containing protein [Coriobacteriia bacterium]
METLKTAIEFVSTGGGGQEGGASAASTGDPLLIVCVIAVILCIGAFLFAFAQRKKAFTAVCGNHMKSVQFNQNRLKISTIILSVMIALSVCGIICSFTTHNAIADNNASDMVPNKITATVDNNTGAVSIEDAYIQNSTDNRILFKTVKIAKTEADGDCTYTLKLDGNEIFRDKADVEKTFDTPIVTANKQTLHIDTDMSSDIAKSFIGKTPLSIEYVFDKDKEASPQKKTDTEEEITKDAETTKTEIDALNLTPVQKEALKKSIDEVLDNTKTAIENAKWESEVDQAKKDGEKQIQGILNNAKAQSLVNTKTETKEQVDSETQQAYDAIKEIVNLSENEKGIFNSEIKEIKSATDSNINNAKTEEEVKQHLQVFENNIEEITTKAEEKALANLESAKESANELIEESSTTTKDQIDLLNLDDEEKLVYNNQINKEAEDTKEAIESRSLITDVEKDKADFKKKIEDIFAEAKAQALIHTKDETKDAVDEESSSGQEYINNMDNLYDDDKNGFTERIETASSICKAGVDAAETENNVVAIHEKFQETLTTIEEEAASKASLNLSNKKAAATDDVIGKTNTAKNNVDLLTLPGSVKNTAKADIEKLSSDSQDNVNDASTLSEVDELFNSFKADLQSLVDEYTELQNSYHSVNVGSSTLVHGSFSTDAEDDLGKEDATITIVYTPEEGKVYTIDEVKVTTAEGEITVKVTGRYASFTMPKGDVTVSVTEIQGYTVTVNNDGHGDASADIDIAKKGATVQLTANPHQGYEFDKWESSDVTISSDNTFDMPEKNVSITAVFKAEAQKRFLAVYDSNATLTFFYDNQPHLSDGSKQTFYNLPTNAAKENDWPYQTTTLQGAIKKIIIDKSMKEFNGLESTAYMCADMINAEDIEGFENLDTSNVKNMSYMFNKYGKSEINYLDLSSFTVNSSINIVSLLDGMKIKSFSLGPNWKDKTMQDAGLREIDWYKLPDGTEALKPAQIPGGVLTEKTTYSDTKPAPPVTPDYCAINIVDEEATAENPATLTIFKDDNDNLLNLNYKINNGEWIPFSSESEWEVPNLTYNDVVYLKGNNFEDTGTSHKGFSTEDYFNSIAVDKKFTVTGEATSLIYGDDTSEKTKNIPGSYCFVSLFDNGMTSKLTSENLLSVSANFLPFTKLTEHCFEDMFYSCESMNPEEGFNLPATSIEACSYCSMFEHCKSLTNVPEELPALELKDSCYYSMFSDCESLVKAPKLPAGVEEGCLAKECYRQMFYLCTSLETTPDLLAPIDQMDKDTIFGCYGGMFYKCKKIESIKVGFQRFPFDPVGSYQYYCTADWMTEGPADNFILIGPEDAHYDDADYNNCDAIPSKNPSPSNCVSITVKDISATDANPAKFTIKNTNGNKPNLSYRVNKQGEFTEIDMSQEVITLNCNLKNNDVLELKGSNTSGFNGNDKYTTFSLNRLFIVSGNVMGLIDADNPPSAIPSEGCFNRLFASSEDSVNKSNLSYISQNFLPATTLKANCYKEMFAYSPYLLTLKNGILPATELSESCYHNMFEHCDRLSLTNDFSLPAGVPDEQGHIVGHLAKSCYRGMFASCASKDEEGHPLGIRTVSKNLLKATNMAEDCYAYMFQYCTNLRISVPDILPAGKENGSLANTCYEGMFFGCTSIFEAPTLPASYDLMNSATDCYKQMFSGCSKLESIKVGFDKFPKNNDAYKCTENWLYGVSGNGKFNGPEDNQYTDDDYNKASAIPWAKPSPKDSYFTITIGQIPEGQPAHFIVKNSEGHQANLLISYNEGDTWYEIPYAPTWQSPELFSGQKILLKGENPGGLNHILDEAAPQSWQYTNFDCDCPYSASGNIMSLLFGDDFKGPRPIEGPPGCFGTLFKNSVNLTNINNLVLPAGSRDQQGQPMSRINTRCYMQMFYNTGIKQIPANLLPAIELFESCYKEMFAHCTELETIDKLILPAGTPDQQGQPQGTLSPFCYESMFEGCDSQQLTKAPSLLAIDAALGPHFAEYKQMFCNCTYLNEITVGFHQFPKNADQYKSTENWLQGVANSGTFHGPEGIVYDESDYNNPNAIPWPKPTPVEKTVKAVYDEKEGANTLTFYYDDSDHSGEGKVETNIPTQAEEDENWPYHEYRESIKKVIIDESMQEYDGFESTAYMCHYMTNAEDIVGFEYLDVSNVVDMRYMFQNYGSNSQISSVPDVSGWKTSNVQFMNSMFSSYGKNSSKLNQAPKCAHVDDSQVWDLSKIKYMSNMFQYYGQFAKNLNVAPDVSGWDFSSNAEGVTMMNLFKNFASGDNSIATKISTLPNVSSWKTDKVSSMNNMFAFYGRFSSGKLESLDLSSFTVSSKTNVTGMLSDMPLHSFSLGPGWFGRSMKDAGLEDKKWYKSDGTELTPADIPGDTPLTEKRHIQIQIQHQ